MHPYPPADEIFEKLICGARTIARCRGLYARCGKYSWESLPHQHGCFGSPEIAAATAMALRTPRYGRLDFRCSRVITTEPLLMPLAIVGWPHASVLKNLPFACSAYVPGGSKSNIFNARSALRCKDAHATVSWCGHHGSTLVGVSWLGDIRLGRQGSAYSAGRRVVSSQHAPNNSIKGNTKLVQGNRKSAQFVRQLDERSLRAIRALSASHAFTCKYWLRGKFSMANMMVSHAPKATAATAKSSNLP